ncbi:MAG: gamma carbonic anhydrase family protein [Candidatus Diapherotrites archaeon]|nr:gamma carbonic anhydrase family protein [Candidatus Diapherotrites archaeon]
MKFIAKNAVVTGDVSIGDNSSIWFNAVVRGDVNKIVIGENTNIQDNAVLHVSRDEGLTIGDNVTIGHGAIVHCKSIGNNVLIGMNATLLPGVIIGNNCIIGAGALVPPNMHVPDNSVVMGIPAKVVRKTTDDDIKRIIENAEEYVRLVREYGKDKA